MQKKKKEKLLEKMKSKYKTRDRHKLYMKTYINWQTN